MLGPGNKPGIHAKKIKSGALPLSFPGQYPQSIMIQGPKATKIKDVYTKI